MLVHDTLQDSSEIETTTASAPPRRGRRRALVAVVAAGALAGAVVFATVSDADTELSPAPAGVTHDQVEANRSAALGDLAAVPQGSHDDVEVNRTAALRDLVVSGASHDEVEVNRAAALRDLLTRP